jgi:hypothetical protein
VPYDPLSRFAYVMKHDLVERVASMFRQLKGLGSFLGLGRKM